MEVLSVFPCHCMLRPAHSRSTAAPSTSATHFNAWAPCLRSRSCSKIKNSRILSRAALGQNNANEVYQGMYGSWSIDSEDIKEVWLYRTGLATSAVAFVSASLTAFIPQDEPLRALLTSSLDIFYLVGSCGLGLSLLLIHIYVTPLKRTLQFLWCLGLIGSMVVALKFAFPEGYSLVNYVIDNPVAIWAVGPLFASLTGVAFKEGLCYGKLETGLLFFVIPFLLLGHLSGALGVDVERGLLATWMGLFTIFAARKFTQPIKDDIGDKSVFMFNALPEDQKEKFLLRLQDDLLSNNANDANDSVEVK